ncbi:hypothetical protein Taro_031717 [Colocasia esculenta]|uniref:Uncharacterized protein n=1 Tax=Colocasia esculenta TaxID=4460 RepID=A0A843VZS5_COLES|nr:hypothetical protein [Colocasia esculenta]
MRAACRARGGAADVWSGKATPEAVAIRFGRTELLQTLLDQGRSCCGSVGCFGILARFSTRSRREDVARSGGNAAPCLDCAFFVKVGRFHHL